MEHNTTNILASEDAQNAANENAEAPIRKVKISEYGYSQAGLHQGDSNSLKIHLGWIKEGHIVDEGFSTQAHLAGKKKVESNIQTKLEEKSKFENEKAATTDIRIAAAKQDIESTKEEIRQVKINVAEKRISSDFQAIRFYTYLTLAVLLSIYLVFFYASAIHSAFFRNPASLIANAGDDIAMYLDSIFDPKAIFTASSSLIFTYFGAFLFFAIGLLPHTMLNSNGKNKKVQTGLLIAGAFLADAALAYKIDRGIHDLKAMAGIPDKGWQFYSSINFYLVLLFGFCAYLVCGQMYEMMIRENAKRNTDKKAEIIINDLKEKMKEQKEALMKLELRVKELEVAIEGIRNQIDRLQKDLESAMANPNELARNLSSFYKGWRQYLMGSPEFETQRLSCETAYNEYINSLFIVLPQSINKN